MFTEPSELVSLSFLQHHQELREGRGRVFLHFPSDWLEQPGSPVGIQLRLSDGAVNAGDARGLRLLSLSLTLICAPAKKNLLMLLL